MATILVIDPDEDSRTILAAMLTYHGHAALRARTPAEAVRLTRARRPALVISELGQSEAVDSELRELLDGGGGPATPLMVLTSHVTEADRARAAAAGCSRFLTKPCPPSDVVREAETLISSNRRGWRRPPGRR